MSKQSFTPGPWTADFLYASDIPENAQVVIHAPARNDGHTGTRVAEAEFVMRPNGYHVDDREEAEANARLIAAAPTQHEEMVRFLPIIERAEADPELWTRLTRGTGIATANAYRAAISKALGEQP